MEPLFGPIDYISIPRFESSNQAKGFCFIEFHDAASIPRIMAYGKEAWMQFPLSRAFPQWRVMPKKTWLTYKKEYKSRLRQQEQAWHNSDPGGRHPITARMFQHREQVGNSTINKE